MTAFRRATPGGGFVILCVLYECVKFLHTKNKLSEPPCCILVNGQASTIEKLERKLHASQAQVVASKHALVLSILVRRNRILSVGSVCALIC
jgi:hypothetical protein